MPELVDARDGLIKFLEEQHAQSSGTEPLSGADRADTFTYHFKSGRGARWLDNDREMLWLLSLRDQHDSGYSQAPKEWLKRVCREGLGGRPPLPIGPADR